jgi:hypothetical protein
LSKKSIQKLFFHQKKVFKNSFFISGIPIYTTVLEGSTIGFLTIIIPGKKKIFKKVFKANAFKISDLTKNQRRTKKERKENQPFPLFRPPKKEFLNTSRNATNCRQNPLKHSLQNPYFADPPNPRHEKKSHNKIVQIHKKFISLHPESSNSNLLKKE